MTHRAICITEDPILRRTLRRTLQATGSTVQFADSAKELVAGDSPDLVVLDPASRREIDPDKVLELFGAKTEVVVVGESLEQDDILQLLRGTRFNHVISEMGQEPDEEELL